jgi:hypothetical protein
MRIDSRGRTPSGLTSVAEGLARGGSGVLASCTGERSEALKGVEESRLDDRHSLTSLATDRSLWRGDDSDRFLAGRCVRQIGSHDSPVSLGLPESVTARSRRSKPSNGS